MYHVHAGDSYMEFSLVSRDCETIFVHVRAERKIDGQEGNGA